MYLISHKAPSSRHLLQMRLILPSIHFAAQTRLLTRLGSPPKILAFAMPIQGNTQDGLMLDLTTSSSGTSSRRETRRMIR
jgi:hypothetical protein